jgi:RNA polymerase sigma-70 factor (ECF subfamily)
MQAHQVKEAIALGETRARLVEVARRFFKDPADREDAAHDAVVQALRHADAFRGDAQIGTWLHRVTVNAALMRLRKRTRERRRAAPPPTGGPAVALELVDEAPVASARLEAEEQAARLRAAVATLPPSYREVVELCLLAETPPQVAARRLGITPSAVRTRIVRARAQLKAKLELATAPSR